MKGNTPGSHQIFFTIISQLYICQQTKESLDSSIKGNLRVFQNHSKNPIISKVEAKISQNISYACQFCQLNKTISEVTIP